MPSPSELVRLLALPNESLAVEYKSWLTLSENHGRATLAKAAIALANHGGGIIVLGMRSVGVDAGVLTSQPRPDGLQRYTQDEVNAAINRYAEPAIHSELLFGTHPETAIEHAFVCVPGQISVPVMSTRDCQGVIAQQRCYIRKPGPRSEEPFLSEEWRNLLDRCIRTGRENMLDAIRLIVQGHAGGAPIADLDALERFAADAEDRWGTLIGQLPPDDAGRMPHGHYEMCFEIGGVPPAPNLRELRARMSVASQTKHTGWGPFVSLQREPFEPRPRNGLVEAWLGQDGENRYMRTPAHCDFWQAHPQGRFFLQRGYDEDGVDVVEPGIGIDFTLPVWRVGEALLYIARVAEQFGENASIIFRCKFTGLQDRRLMALNGRRHLFGDYRCDDDVVIIATQVQTRTIFDNLAEVIHPLLSPMYERFSFFELSMELITSELELMRQNHF
jgi:hypothetical protein